MSARGAAVERPARILVGTVDRVRRYRTTTSLLGLLLVLLTGSGYLLFGALDINPFAAQYRIRVELRESGGLLPGQDVTLRGVRVGEVDSVEVAGGKVVAVAAIDERIRIPATGRVRTAALSAAGEQYLDFLPDTDIGPYLQPGAVVTQDRTSSPVPLSTMLEGLSGILAQADPEQLRAISGELGVDAAGPEKLAALIDGGFFMISTLDGVLPQTVNLLRNSRTVLGTIAETAPSLRDTAAGLSTTMGGIAAMTGGFEHLVTRTPETLAAIDTLMAQNGPTMVQLLGELTTVAQMANPRVPAFEEFFFPKQRSGSALDAMATAFHDGKIWALASIYPRYQCDYQVPRAPGPVPDYPEPYLYSDCTDPDPTLLPRGARNAPRPPGVSPLPVVPPGAHPLDTADPTPSGPLTIPTPYGGPYTPTYVPPN